MSCSVYHFFEFLFVCNYHFEDLSFDSKIFVLNLILGYLINQSKEFGFAIIFSFLEYLIGFYFAPWIKYNFFTFLVGGLFMLMGHFCRIGALFTAKSNFTHLVAFKKRQKHVLVTNGIYGLLRHPSYFGFFFWAIGAQIICMNPISLIAYYFVLCEFFSGRIRTEEIYLRRFFGEDYTKYKKMAGIYIPFWKKDE